MADAGQNNQAGQRSALLYLSKDGVSKAGAMLGNDFHLLTLAPDATRSFVDARGGGEKLSVIARGAAAEQALALAISLPDSVEAVALIAPPSLDEAGVAALTQRWGETKVPVMVLFGTRDRVSPPSSGGAYRRAIARCNVMFVYDAGSDMDNERPEAVAAVLRQFIVSKDRFVVSRESGVLYP